MLMLIFSAVPLSEPQYREMMRSVQEMKTNMSVLQLMLVIRDDVMMQVI